MCATGVVWLFMEVQRMGSMDEPSMEGFRWTFVAMFTCFLRSFVEGVQFQERERTVQSQIVMYSFVQTWSRKVKNKTQASESAKGV